MTTNSNEAARDLPDATGSQMAEEVAARSASDLSILALPGSIRRGSYNRMLLNSAVECAPAGMTVLIHEELASIPLFNEDLELATDGGPDVVRRLRRQVASADGLFLATPEYNHSIPGVLKNAIDWLSRPGPEEVLVGKPVVVIGASSGRWGTRLAQSALRQVLYATESLVLARPAMFVREAGRLFDGTGRLVDPPTRKELEAVLAAFSDWITLLRPRQGSSAIRGPGAV